MTTLKAGFYFIGDPCYAFNKSWDKFLEAKEERKDNQLFNELPFFATYLSQDLSQADNWGNDYPVDSLTIGCIPVAMLLIDKAITIKEVNIAMTDEHEFFGQIVEFKKPFSCSNEGTYIRIGHFEIGRVEVEDCDEEYCEEEGYW